MYTLLHRSRIHEYLIISTNNEKYIYHLNNIYIIITPTYFDKFVSSSGFSKVLHCYNYVTLAMYSFGNP